MKLLPLTVLFYEGPIARAYLAMLRAKGFRVNKIIRMVPRSGWFGRLLPSGLRRTMSATNQHRAAHYWPTKIPSMYPALYSQVKSQIENGFGLDGSFISEIRRNEDLETYSDTVVEIETTGIKDPGLAHALSLEPKSLVLFTGGGIVPRQILELPNVRLLHVHPGHLPDIRGGDGLLWSMLVRGKPGASAFIMKPGIDDGDLVTLQDFEPLTFTIPPDGGSPDDQTLYRMIFSYYDPVLRAAVLARTVALHPELTEIEGTPQDLTLGRTYHFMEKRLRHLALKHIFGKKTAVG